MRRAVLTLATLATIGLAAGTAFARHGRDCGFGYDSYGRYGGYGSYGRYGYDYYSQPRGYGYYSSSPLGVREAMSRVHLDYPRARYNPHPRSFYGPAYLYGYPRR